MIKIIVEFSDRKIYITDQGFSLLELLLSLSYIFSGLVSKIGLVFHVTIVLFTSLISLSLESSTYFLDV